MHACITLYGAYPCHVSLKLVFRESLLLKTAKKCNLLMYFCHRGIIIIYSALLWENTYHWFTCMHRYQIDRYLMKHFPWLTKRCYWTKLKAHKIQATSSPQPGLFSMRTLTRVLCVVCSLLGLTVSGYFYCGCLFYLFVKSDSLRQVLTAVRLGGEEMNFIMHFQISLVATLHD